MPELPDLENFSKNIFKLVQSKTVTCVEVFNSKCITGISVLEQAIKNTHITAIRRSGKELFFIFNNDHCLSVHLMLYGRFEFCHKQEISALKGKIATFHLDGNQALTICDGQGLARLTVDAKPNDVPDALSSDFTYLYFLSVVAQSRRSIKALLLDQSFVKGIGNAYADEILWAARVDGESVACKISLDVTQTLYEAVSDVLRSAIISIERIAPNIIGGEERSFLSVHNPKVKCDPLGNPILTRTVASKYTYYTQAQILYK